MKSHRLINFVIIAVLFAATVLGACASGEIDPREGQQTQADAQGDDAFQDDIGFDDKDAVSEPSDTGASDADDSDAASEPDAEDPDATNDTGPDTDPGVECTSDNDCANGGRCHDREPVCVPSCCDSVTTQDSFTAVSYSHNRFDIAVTDAGDPAIVFVDGDTNAIKYAQSINGQWFSQDIGTVSNSLSTHVRLSLASDGTPHVIVGRYDLLVHYWQGANGWQSDDLLPASPDPISVSYVDIAVDVNDDIHMVALLGYGDDILYVNKTAQGLLSTENLANPAPNDPVWTNIGVTSDGRPIASFQIGLDKTLVIAERSTSGTWSYEIIGQDVSQLHGLAVDRNDNPVVAYRKATSDGLRILRRQSQSWQDELIVANADHGYSPDVAVDSLGDPHIVYMAQGAGQYENPLYYARWNGAQWENHQLTSVARAFYPRVAIDASRTPHAVVYDPSNDTISYLKIQ